MIEKEKKKKKKNHPHIRLAAGTNEEDYKDLISFTKISPMYKDVVTDSGAQCLWGLQPFLHMGFKLSDILIKIIDTILLRSHRKECHRKEFKARSTNVLLWYFQP